MARKYTILQYADQLEVLRKNLDKAILPPLRKGQRDIVKALKENYWKHPLGEKIWNWRKEKFLQPKSGPVVRRKRARYSHTNQAYIAQVDVEGLAATIESGGRLRRHNVFGRAIIKPGAVVSRRSALDNIVDRRFPQVVDDASKAFGELVDDLL